MSVSSHLTPDPERRLRLIHGNIHNSLKWADTRLGAITFLAAVQMAAVKIVLPVGLLGGSPFIETPKQLPLLDPRKDKLQPGDFLVTEHDIARYSQAELVIFLDRYLGGGITATPYYEDIIAQIVIGARIATRKNRFFGGACVLAVIAQLCLIVQLII